MNSVTVQIVVDLTAQKLFLAEEKNTFRVFN
jgi:hypothetical protein